MAEVTGRGLVHQRSLAPVCTVRSRWLGSVLVDVAGLGLVPHISLTWACTCRGHWPRHAPVEVIGSVLLWWMLLASG